MQGEEELGVRKFMREINQEIGFFLIELH